MTQFTDAIKQAIDTEWFPGQLMVFRVTCSQDARATLNSCQFWSTTLKGEGFTHRADIPLSGTETRLDVARALTAAGHTYPLTPEAEPRWRVDANGITTYVLDVHRAAS